MKKTITFIVFAYSISLVAQTRADYDAAVGKFQRFYNVSNADSIFSMYSDRIKGLMPMDKTAAMLNQLTTKLGDMKSYEFGKADGNISYYKTGFANADLLFSISLDKDHKLAAFNFAPYHHDTISVNKEQSAINKEKSNLVLKTAMGSIYGTLTVPTDLKKMPVVLIIAGSGPTDRDCNSQIGLKSDAYKMVADSLLKAGIACARYDKLGVGESKITPEDKKKVRFDDQVNDAAGLIKMLRDDGRFSKIIVLGHSEGSLIGMVAAYKEKADGFISLSGIAERADKIIEKQVASQSKELAQTAKVMLDSLDKGNLVTDVDPLLASLFSAASQPYLISWLKYDPSAEIKKLRVPVLILQGANDVQVGVEEAENLKKAYPHSSLKIIPGMNHILKQAPEDRQSNLATYNNPNLPLSPGLMPDMVGFIKSVE